MKFTNPFVMTVLVMLCWASLGMANDTDGDSLSGAAAPKLDRPNIIFILADDLGYGDIGVLWQNSIAGSKKFATPNFDRMAAEGLILNQHYTGAPVCAPARGTLLTGVHQGHCTIRNRDFDDALEHNHTLGSTLQRAGYATALIGKYGL